MIIEIFQFNGMNSTPDWFVAGPDSFSFYIGTYDHFRPSQATLARDAMQTLRAKDLSEWAAGKDVQIRASDIPKTREYSESDKKVWDNNQRCFATF